jgi:hypothetical protein
MTSPKLLRATRAAGSLLLLAGYVTPLQGAIRSGYFFSLLTGPVIDGSMTAALHLLKPVGVLLIVFMVPARTTDRRGLFFSGSLFAIGVEEFLFFLTLAWLESNSAPGWLGLAGALLIILSVTPALTGMGARTNRLTPDKELLSPERT